MIRGKSWDEGWLTVYWGRESRGDRKDLMFGSPNRPDGSLLHTAFCFQEIHGKTLIQHLEERGYDISTLQFSVKRNRKPNEEPVTRDWPDLRLEKAQGTAEPEKKEEGKVKDEAKDEKPLEDLPLTDPIRWALESILAALPVKRDWLDPELEKLAKDALAEKPRNADESESVYFGFSNKQYADRLADYKKVMADAKDVAPGTYLFDPSKQAAQEEQRKRENELVTAFIQGAKWWEWHKQNATMWQSDQRLAYEEAIKYLRTNMLGVGMEDRLSALSIVSNAMKELAEEKKAGEQEAGEKQREPDAQV